MSPHHEEPPQGGVSNGDYAQPFDFPQGGEMLMAIGRSGKLASS
jgi:hypothetical protein